MDDIKKNTIKETKVQNAFEALRKEDDYNDGEHIDDTHNTKEPPNEWADQLAQKKRKHHGVLQRKSPQMKRLRTNVKHLGV